jgi:hypothetical protein
VRVPNILYKYRPLALLHVLAERRIRFTQPVVFNDPFECRPILTPGRETETQRRLVTALRQAIQQVLGIPAALPSGDQYPHEAANEGLLGALSNSVGILSLSENPTDLQMWAHYAESHTGFVIGFDATHGWLGSVVRAPTIGALNAVRYVSERKRVNWDELSPLDLYYIKAAEWRHEREWRVVRNVGDLERVPGDHEPPVMLAEFPLKLVKRVIVGHRASRDLRRDLAQIVRSTGYFSPTFDPTPTRYCK